MHKAIQPLLFAKYSCQKYSNNLQLCSPFYILCHYIFPGIKGQFLIFSISLPGRTPYNSNDQFLLNFYLLQNSFRICLFDSGFHKMVQNACPKAIARPCLNIGLLPSTRRIHPIFSTLKWSDTAMPPLFLRSCPQVSQLWLQCWQCLLNQCSTIIKKNQYGKICVATIVAFTQYTSQWLLNWKSTNLKKARQTGTFTLTAHF